MDTTLLIVTALSLIVAMAMSVKAWRTVREERRRTAARVAALSVAAGSSPVDQARSSTERSRAATAELRVPRSPWARSPLSTVQGAEPRLSSPEPQVPSPAIIETRAASRPILGTTEEPQVSRGGQRGLAAAAAVLFVVLIGGLAWMMAGRQGSVATAASPSAPLELVSLRHERQTSKLAVSGLVRNPAAGQPVDHLSAVVFLFDQQGSFVTSAKAPVDFVRLGSGDESPFVIKMDAPATIARYRVSFRTDSGVVPHVDRRGASPIAAQAEQATSLPVK
jgi:hypothetical protein